MAIRLTQQRTEALRQVSLFHGCSEAELALINALVDDIEVDAGEVLTQEADATLDAFIVVTGMADLVVEDRPVATLGPGSLFGSLGLLNSPQLWKATVVARTPMRLVVVGDDRVAELVLIPAVAAEITARLTLCGMQRDVLR